jgi:hypothetical protein
LTPSEYAITETRTNYQSTNTSFDHWLTQNQETPKIWSKSHLQLLDDLTSDPVSITDPSTFHDAHLQQLHQFDYDGPCAHYDIGSSINNA